MSFCWFTGFIGYPNFIRQTGRGYELAETFLTLVGAADNGLTYEQSKTLFPALDHAQVETKKAAFQEFGLLYVTPRSNTISVTPLGRQIYRLCHSVQADELDQRAVLLGLSQGLSRYQFNNPLPVGGNRYRTRAGSSDLRPYLVMYYLMLKLDGMVTLSEIFGRIFGIQNMDEVPNVVHEIFARRQSGIPYPKLSQLPPQQGTANNLKIYFMSHISLDLEIIKDRNLNVYGNGEQTYEITELGYEILQSILDQEWPDWRMGTNGPVAAQYSTIDEYFRDGVGKAYSDALVQADYNNSVQNNARLGEGVVVPEDLEALKQLTKREFEEGRQKLVTHTKLEKTRNQALVKAKKRITKQLHGSLKCEVCQFDFSERYGERGEDYIEAHHIEPIVQLTSSATLTIDDLALVCANCHRMLHQTPWITVEELKELVAQHCAT